MPKPNTVTWQMPRKSAELLRQSLELDAVSTASDRKLRGQIQRALKTVRVIEPAPAPRKRGKRRPSPGCASRENCETCRHIGETTCGGDSFRAACYEPR